MKKVISLIVILCVCISLVGCHGKNAVVATYGDFEVSSGLYAFLIASADAETRDIVDDQHEGEEGYDSSSVNYYKMKVAVNEDGSPADKIEEDSKTVKFADFVRARADLYMKQYLYVEDLAKQKELSLTEEEISNSDSLAEYYWAYYGYQSMYEPNGVSKDTYKEYMQNQQLTYSIFEHLYKIDGEKGKTDKEYKKAFNDNYVLADVVTVNLYSSNSDGTTTDYSKEDKADVKAELESFAKQFNNGEKTFKEIWKNYNKDADESQEPNYTVVFGSEKTSASQTYYDKVKGLIENKKIGKAKVVESEDAKQYALVVPQDISKDKTYYEQYTEDVMNFLFSDEYQTTLETESGKLEVKINGYEHGYIKPQKVVYPQASY